MNADAELIVHDESVTSSGAAVEMARMDVAVPDPSLRYLHRYAGVIHPFCIGRHPRIAMMDELLSYINGFPDVWFATHLEVAEEWRRIRESEGRWDEPQTATGT